MKKLLSSFILLILCYCCCFSQQGGAIAYKDGEVEPVEIENTLPVPDNTPTPQRAKPQPKKPWQQQPEFGVFVNQTEQPQEKPSSAATGDGLVYFNRNGERVFLPSFKKGSGEIIYLFINAGLTKDESCWKFVAKEIDGHAKRYLRNKVNTIIVFYGDKPEHKSFLKNTIKHANVLLNPDNPMMYFYARDNAVKLTFEQDMHMETVARGCLTAPLIDSSLKQMERCSRGREFACCFSGTGIGDFFR